MRGSGSQRTARLIGNQGLIGPKRPNFLKVAKLNSRVFKGFFYVAGCGTSCRFSGPLGERW